MTNIKDSGPALLDYLAAKAMQRLLSTSEGYDLDEQTIARVSYSQADAMMAEKQRRLARSFDAVNAARGKDNAN